MKRFPVGRSDFEFPFLCGIFGLSAVQNAAYRFPQECKILEDYMNLTIQAVKAQAPATDLFGNLF